MKKISILVIVTILLSGCWDVEEADRMDYSHGIAVDYEDEKVIMHLQLVNLGTLGTPETTTQESQTAIATSKATNLNEAVFDIYSSAQRRIYWGHTTFILITERALKAGKLKEVLDLIDRFSQTRYRIRIAVTKDHENLTGLLEVTPIFESSAIFTKLTDLSNTYQQNSFVRPLSIRELIIMFDEPGYNAIIPTVKLNKKSWQMDQKSYPMVEMEGVALVKENELQGFLLDGDANGLRWMGKLSSRNDLTVMKDDKPASELVIVDPKAKVNIETNGDEVIFHAQIKATGSIHAMLQKMDQEDIKKEAEKAIKEEVMKTFKKGLEKNSDVYRLSEKLYRRDLTTWQKLEEDGMIPLTEKSLNVEVELDLSDAKINKTEPIIK